MIKYIHPAPVSSADGIVADMYKQIKRDFGFVGDIFIMHSHSPALLAGLWAAMRESELTGSVPRGVKEAVAAGVSKANQCSFCIDAHSTMMMAAGDSDAAKKLLANKADEITDSKQRAIVQWALATRSPGSPALLNPPFSAKEAPEMIGTAILTHYITRMMDVLLTNKAIVSVKIDVLNAVLKKGLAVLFSSSIRKSRKHGESLIFLPEAELPDDLGWAKSNPIVSRAFACFAEAAEAAGKSALTDETRMVVRQYIHEWDGTEPPLGRKWLDTAISPLSGSSRIPAEVALLTAIAPYRISEDLIGEFQAAFKADVKLVNLLSWASFTAARKIGNWYALPES